MKPVDSHLAATLQRAYELMLSQQGHQQWWPGDTPFEICVGAILVQNTNWGNVERALNNLKKAGALEPEKLFALPEKELADLIRPAGYFNVKAQRLRAFLAVLVNEFAADLTRFFTGTTLAVRERLLRIKGVGPETADSMLLYAGDHHSFVIDAYTKRIFQRHNWWRSHRKNTGKGNHSEEYQSLKALCETALTEKDDRLDHWQDYHAQLVMAGKDYCRPNKTRCDLCPLKSLLPKDGPAKIT